jgi:hypothetical protein
MDIGYGVHHLFLFNLDDARPYGFVSEGFEFFHPASPHRPIVNREDSSLTLHCHWLAQ